MVSDSLNSRADCRSVAQFPCKQADSGRINYPEDALMNPATSHNQNVIRTMPIKTRLLLSFGVVLLMMVAAALTGRWGMSSLHQVVTASINGDVALAQAAGDLNSGVLTLRRFEKDTFINIHVADTVASYHAKWQAALQNLRDDLVLAKKVATPETLQSLNTFSNSIDAYENGFVHVYSLITAGQITTTQQANDEMTKFKDAVRSTESLVENIKSESQQRVAQINPSLQAKRRSLDLTLLILTCGAFLVAGGLALVITRRITFALNEAVQLAKKVAGGELGHQPQAITTDELGELTKALQEMDQQLYTVIANVRRTAAEVNSAAREISQGNDNLSERTQEQASSLEETAASMEEMTASVKQNADSTTHATELAHRARTIAEEGGNVVQQAVNAMVEINGSSKRIADIISVIDEIAFQTNLLALNAAVEAARAGEQGRGFAVVATEVRNLAQRSAAAAREIKTLIHDSADKVDAGARLVEQSGQSLTEIVNSTKQVAALVDEISMANKEQSAGIMQVNHVVTQLDSMTQHNAAAVEEVAAASKALEGQAEMLAREVGHFRLANDSGWQAPVPAVQPMQSQSIDAGQSLAA
jgi:methyl-accepting chemotaxis protein